MRPARLVPLIIAALLLLAWGWLSWVRGPQPENDPPSPEADAAAGTLLEATRAYLAGEAAGDERPGDGTWYVTLHPRRARAPVTVRADGPVSAWADRLKTAGTGYLQVDLAIEPTPAARPGPRGLGLDIGYDGWVEDDGDVHLPVEFVLQGKKRRELAAFLREHPGEPLRTYAWVRTADGHARMLRASIDPGELTPELLRERCDLGGDYLMRHLRRNHRYDYGWDAREGQRTKGYNLLRHAGTTYSIFQLYNHTGQERHYEAAADALEYLRERRRFASGDDSRCFEVRGNKVKLGGAGLTLLALVEQAKARPEDAEWEWIHCLAEHIVHETGPDGDMASFYTDGGIYEWSDHRSIYYPGEALLGLVRLYEIDPDPRWQETAVRAADFLVHERWKALGIRVQIPPDAWLIQALEVLHRQVPDDAYADYAFAIGGELTRYQVVQNGVPPDLWGGRLQPGFPQVISTGSRGEGMAAAAKLERRLRPGETFYLERLRANSTYALRNQYTEPILFGLRRPEKALGGFRNSPVEAEIRIDGVQHNLSGLLGLLELLEDDVQ